MFSTHLDNCTPFVHIFDRERFESKIEAYNEVVNIKVMIRTSPLYLSYDQNEEVVYIYIMIRNCP